MFIAYLHWDELPPLVQIMPREMECGCSFLRDAFLFRPRCSEPLRHDENFPLSARGCTSDRAMQAYVFVDVKSSPIK
jgi:hypothetical protein